MDNPRDFTDARLLGALETRLPLDPEARAIYEELATRLAIRNPLTPGGESLASAARQRRRSPPPFDPDDRPATPAPLARPEGLRIDLTTRYSKDEIQLTMSGPPPLDTTVRQVVKLYDDAVRQALIRLGWTPPAGERDDHGAGVDAETPACER